MEYKGNIGTLFTKTYFSLPYNIKEDENGKFQLKFTNLKEHFKTLKNDVLLGNFSIPELLGNKQFNLTTIYPGLLIGSGYAHNVLGDDALKLGFFFDHTTGLPCIPGSSVKGVLRDACKKVDGNYILSIIEELNKGDRKISEDIEENGEKNNKILEYAHNFLKENKESLQPIDQKKKLDDKNPSHFINGVFNGIDENGDNLALNKRDIFFDAFPINSDNDGGKFLANDYITHHKDPLKDPNPVQFLKVLPQVTFRFDFKLTDEGMNRQLKLELFRQILLDLGIGAKTNVGYGQFTEYVKGKGNAQVDNSNNEEHINVQVERSATKPKQIVPLGIRLNKNEEFEAVIFEKLDEYFSFKFIKDDEEIILPKKIINVYKKFEEKGIKTELAKNDKVIIKIQGDFINSLEDVPFSVLKKIS